MTATPKTVNQKTRSTTLPEELDLLLQFEIESRRLHTRGPAIVLRESLKERYELHPPDPKKFKAWLKELGYDRASVLELVQKVSGPRDIETARETIELFVFDSRLTVAQTKELLVALIEHLESFGAESVDACTSVIAMHMDDGSLSGWPAYVEGLSPLQARTLLAELMEKMGIEPTTSSDNTNAKSNSTPTTDPAFSRPDFNEPIASVVDQSSAAVAFKARRSPGLGKASPERPNAGGSSVDQTWNQPGVDGSSSRGRPERGHQRCRVHAGDLAPATNTPRLSGTKLALPNRRVPRSGLGQVALSRRRNVQAATG